MQEEQQY